jgi:hypothetical protein
MNLELHQTKPLVIYRLWILMQSLSQLVVFIIDACYYFCCVHISRLSLIKTLALVIFD